MKKIKKGWGIVLQFLIGGTIVAVASYLARTTSSKVANLFWAIPMTFIPVIIYLYLNKIPRTKITSYTGNMLPSLLILLLYFTSLFLLLKTKLNFWLVFTIAIVIWGILIALYWIFICPSPFGGVCIGKNNIRVQDVDSPLIDIDPIIEP